jgi:hypothetical protein
MKLIHFTSQRSSTPEQTIKKKSKPPEPTQKIENIGIDADDFGYETGNENETDDNAADDRQFVPAVEPEDEQRHEEPDDVVLDVERFENGDDFPDGDQIFNEEERSQSDFEPEDEQRHEEPNDVVPDVERFENGDDFPDGDQIFNEEERSQSDFDQRYNDEQRREPEEGPGFFEPDVDEQRIESEEGPDDDQPDFDESEEGQHRREYEEGPDDDEQQREPEEGPDFFEPDVDEQRIESEEGQHRNIETAVVF